ncbi:hypothetical protein NDN01_00885 [Sphingomonas sp. QA11]|uniref:hypothetical protein n=1 Tax=Sphingomonas sp. QA11 TaxID=2950605 RepID=UPI00234B1E5E|nr:hypothetical protein [Sphingomonas sp. QA11]WCM27523.1 hypothetical protein NDN01_00885 [Sphingomonas sp. QA11]
MRIIILAASVAVATASPAQISSTPDRSLVQAVVELSSTTCYGIQSGTIALPADGDPDALGKTMAAVKAMGLNYGVDNRVFKDLGRAGTAMISRATIGSRTLPAGDLVITFGGPQPLCRVILLTAPTPGLTDAVAARIVAQGWKAASVTQASPAVERRAFVRRDAAGNPYLMNLIAAVDTTSRLRLFTTVVRIPPGVALPPGL